MLKKNYSDICLKSREDLIQVCWVGVWMKSDQTQLSTQGQMGIHSQEAGWGGQCRKMPRRQEGGGTLTSWLRRVLLSLGSLSVVAVGDCLWCLFSGGCGGGRESPRDIWLSSIKMRVFCPSFVGKTWSELTKFFIVIVIYCVYFKILH